jgi:phosphoesterase RecJ-like protein
MLRDVLSNIEQRSRFVLTSHSRPDGDAIGSVLACSALLRQIGKQVEVVLRDPVPSAYRSLPFVDSVIQAPYVRNRYETAIILECDSVQRTALEGLDGRFLINIDHHYTGRPFANVNWIEPDACAVAELIFRLAREAGMKISPEIATCLYTAVLTDTGMFAFKGTNADTFGLAKELVLCGADPVKIAQQVYFSNPTSKMRLLGAALSKLHREGSLAWMYITRNDMERCGAMDEDCEGVSNYVVGIEGVEVAVFFRQLTDRRHWRASLRSKGTINVAEIAERFGGGGHTAAAGCGLPGPLSVASERILAQLRMAKRQTMQ